MKKEQRPNTTPKIQESLDREWCSKHSRWYRRGEDCPECSKEKNGKR